MFRGVYAVGHRAVPIEGWLVAALLHAGAGAALSHATAAWWWGLIPDQPSLIDVSAWSRAKSVAGIVVHRRRRFATTRHNRFPITTVAQTLLDFAATAPLHKVRKALAEADYRSLLDVGEVEGVLGPGRSGSARLRLALAEHQPRLAFTQSELEDAFFSICESRGIVLPEVNVWVAGWKVDAFWADARLVVELDGYRNHRSPAQLKRDRRKELDLRRAGIDVIRYSEEQVRTGPDTVGDDVLARRAERVRGARCRPRSPTPPAEPDAAGGAP
jgi:hypothetical protein